MTAEPFQAQGAMSQRDACLIVFRAMEVGEWIEAAELVHRVRELIEYDGSAESIHGAAWSARENLAASAEVGVEAHLGGYKRLTADGQVQAATKRLRRARRGIKRTVRWAGAALANPEVTGPDRLRMERIRSIHVAQSQLEERRALRRRPD